VYADVNPISTTKRLVFSSWKVVPKIIAAVVSHEAERQAIGHFPRQLQIENTSEGRKQISALLRFNRSENGPAGMPVLGLLYPSSRMAAIFDPANGGGAKLTIKEALTNAAQELKPHLEQIITRWSSEDETDERWYWAAPILLDLAADEEATLKFWRQPNLAEAWSGKVESHDHEEEEEQAKDSAWAEHVKDARLLVDEALIKGNRPLGKPPKNLLETLAKSLLGNPAILTLRAICRVVNSGLVVNESVRLSAARVAWRLRNLFNLPEVISLVRGINAEEPYWLRVIEYNVDGCLQSVLDEYAHVLRESLSVSNVAIVEAAEKVSAAMCSAIGLRSAGVGVDEIRAGSRGKITIERRQMRARFAARFGHAHNDQDGPATRSDHVRAAFNSPFWPFVLASTSVGQEGLDFHHYCHAIIHWNLPTNPVDLEQREGRIHRYKGHAVRKNVALKYGNLKTRLLGDRWSDAFNAAETNRSPQDSEMTPFWVFPDQNGASIDRYVPSLPLSRDVERFANLRNTLAIYRMVFGQPRQDELVTYLLERFDPKTVSAIAKEHRTDLEPPKST